MLQSSTRTLLSTVLLVGLSSCDSSPTDPDDPNNQGIPTTCELSNTLELSVGESAELQGNAAALVCMQTTSSHASYVLVATSTATTARTFTFEATGTNAAVSPPTPVGPVAMPAGVAPEHGLVADIEFHARLREAAQQELSVEGRGSGEGPSSIPAFAPAAAPPAVGALLTLNAQSASQQGCSNPINVVGRVIAVSNKAIVVADTLNPGGGLTTADYQGFANFFDAEIAPLTEEYFGAVSDIDGNGRTILLFTREVNRLTSAGSTSYIGGFFHPRDLLPRSGPGSCSTSNVGEILYLMAADPGGTINGNQRDAALVRRITASTMVHEQQHLINAAQRRHFLNLPSEMQNEERWLNEGLSHLAEELLFYRMSQLAPENNYTYLFINSRGMTQPLFDYQYANFERLELYLETPSTTSPYHSTDGLDTRGASWSFLRYVVDRQPTGSAQFVRSIVSSPTIGIPNLSAAVGGSMTFFQWLADWGVAIYADNRVTNSSSDRYQITSWHLPAMYSGLPTPPPTYPIRTVALLGGTTHNQNLVGGGSVYFRFGVGTGTVGSVKVRPEDGAAAPPTTLRLTLLRTR